ncbi:MAG: potassium channel protein [Candidatus Bathyarchaeota archaeon]|nr:MAG: potassium channel protein [Candidatus Bathyarchaeota archaeon]
MVEPEKIEFKPVSVRNTLTEMKNLSEVMIDLAYSAALFHNHELANEVLELEKRVDYFAYLVNMNVLLAARDAEDAESFSGILTVASATNEISDAAADIASLVLQEIGVHPIIRQAFSKMEEQLTRVEVKDASLLTKRKLEELDLAAAIGVDIIAIRRGTQWIIDPNENEVILKNDVMFARGAPKGVEKLHGLATGKRITFE